MANNNFKLFNTGINDTVNQLFVNSQNNSRPSSFNIEDVLKNDSINDVIINPRSRPDGFSVENIFVNDVVNVSAIERVEPNPSNQFIMYTPTEFSTAGEDTFFPLVKQPNQSSESIDNIFTLPGNNSYFITQTKIEILSSLEPPTGDNLEILNLGGRNEASGDNDFTEMSTYTLAQFNNDPINNINRFFTGNKSGTRDFNIQNTLGELTSGSAKITMTYASNPVYLYSSTNFATFVSQGTEAILVKNSVQPGSPSTYFILDQRNINISKVTILPISPVTYTGPLPTFQLSRWSEEESNRITTLTLNDLNNGVIKSSLTFADNGYGARCAISIALDTAESVITSGSFKVLLE